MRKQILEALKAKFEGVSEAVLGRIADKLAKTVTTEEQVATAVEGVTLQQVIDGYADSRATEAQKTAVRSYEQKHGLKDGVKVKEGAPEDEDELDEGGEKTPKWARTLIEQNKALTEPGTSQRPESSNSKRLRSSCPNPTERHTAGFPWTRCPTRSSPRCRRR